MRIDSDAFDTSESSLRLPQPRLSEASFHGADGTKITGLTDERLCQSIGTRVLFTFRSGGVSSAPYGSLNLSYTVGDADADVRENQRRLLSAFGAGEVDGLVQPNQVHGNEVLVVDDVAETQRLARAGADGIVCTKTGVPVLLCFADCTPVILVAPDGSFAVLHAGWRGAIADIAGIGLRKLAEQASCSPADCNCYIGPHIGSCCYEVSRELLDRFVDEYGPDCDAGSRRLDLSAAVGASLVRAGADAARIADARLCTQCNTVFLYSYRAEDGVTGRHGAFAYREVD